MAFFLATIENEVFIRPPKNMRKDKTIWKLLKAMYGTQVASSRWQRFVRETLCDGHLKVLTSVPCVARNETEDSLVVFHGVDFLLKVTTVHWTSWMKCWVRSRSNACHVLVQQQVVRACFLHRTIRWNESGFSYRPDPKHVDALIVTLSLEDARPVATPFTRDTGQGQANTLCELSVTEKAIYMSGSGLLQHIALD